jgi:hypothetical protein
MDIILETDLCSNSPTELHKHNLEYPKMQRLGLLPILKKKPFNV